MATTIAAPKKKTAPATQEDFLPLEGTDHIEFYVGNAKQAAHCDKSVFGFQSLAYAGPETGIKDRASYAIRQNKLTFVLTTPLRPNNEIADHVQKHGDGVKVIALKVKDATSAWKETTKRGGKSYMEPDRKSTRLNSSHSQISYAVFCLKKKHPHQPSPPSVACLRVLTSLTTRTAPASVAIGLA